MKFIVFILSYILLNVCLDAQEDFYHPELEWRTIQTEHFYVHYHTGAERTARIIAKIAEDIYEPVTSLYRYKPKGRVSFIVKDYNDYSNGATYFFDNRIEIWASALDSDLRGTHNWLRNVVTHEYTHMVQIQAALKFGRKIPAVYLQWLQYESERRTDVLYGYPNGIISYPVSGFVVPMWFAEGVAQYNRKEFEYDSWDAHRDMILRMYTLDGKLLSWNQMATFGKTSLGNESSYNSGFALVRYIAERYGENKLREITENLSSITALTVDGAVEGAIGKTGEELYNEWKDFLEKDYAARTEAIREKTVTGRTVADVGFANLYPAFSPDGKKLAYISNKEGDYFLHSSVYLYDLVSKKDKLIRSNVNSTLSWSPDGRKIYYAKQSLNNSRWRNLLDLYVYDIQDEEETRLTRGLRAGSPAVSPDGKALAFLAGSDGTLNLFTANADGSGIKQLTVYKNGEQLYNPKWSPDGKTIVFDYSVRDGRDIASVSAAGGEVVTILATRGDERNAAFTPDGKHIVYASDETGIFNLYRYDLNTHETEQVTNVLGGAFMPAVGPGGEVAFSSYTSGGYKVAVLDSIRPVESDASYRKPSAPIAVTENEGNAGRFDWSALSSYDDTDLPSFKETEYKNSSTGLSLFPLIRVDNYNPKNKGIDILKLGLYGYSCDVLDRYGFFAGAAFNTKFERDLFFIFDYRGKVPGLFQLGMVPTLSFEVYNITRKADNTLSLREDLNIPVSIIYNLLEFDISFKHKLFIPRFDMELRYTHSRYNADVESFRLEDPLSGSSYLIPSFGTTYLKGNSISLIFKFDGILLSRTQDINPVGRKVNLRYEYEFHNFNPKDTVNDNYEVVSIYEKPRFHRLSAGWREHVRLPAWKHTLSADLRGGTVFGPPVDNFFNFYIGGLAGMKGYTFYSLGGNEFLMANLTYRFPIFENIDARILHVIFNNLYGAVYGDVGSAWTGGGPANTKFKRDAGAELRLEAFSYYAFPTRIFINATYGIDKFSYLNQNTNETVVYGKEWNFHFGVLFGFELN